MRFKAYLRVSTDTQAESKLGIEAQKHACIEHAKRQGMEVEEFFCDAGFSGGLPMHKRPALFEAVNSLIKDDVLLVAKRDRLGRDVLVVWMIEKEVKKRKAKIVSIAGEGTNNEDPASIFTRRLIDAASEYESQIISERIKVAMAVKKRRNERLGFIPYGYKLAENGVNIVANEEEINMISIITYMRQMGYTFRKIASELNFEGKLNRGKPWIYVSIFNLLGRVKLEKDNNL